MRAYLRVAWHHISDLGFYMWIPYGYRYPSLITRSLPRVIRGRFHHPVQVTLLRSVTPMPERERGELKRSVAALGAIGRNLNQLVRAANQGRVTGPSIGDLKQLLRACEALREHIKGLVNANRDSWEGYEEAHR